MKGCGVVNEKAWYLCLVTALTVSKPRSIPKHKFAALNPGPYPGNQNTNLPEDRNALLQIQFGHCLYRIQIDPRTLAKLPWKVFGLYQNKVRLGPNRIIFDATTSELINSMLGSVEYRATKGCVQMQCIMHVACSHSEIWFTRVPG